jgi:TonB family protein
MKSLILTFLLGCSLLLNAQEALIQENNSTGVHFAQKDSIVLRKFNHGVRYKYSIILDTIYVEPSGSENLYTILNYLRLCVNLIPYPEIALCAGVEGHMILSLIIDDYGGPQSVDILRSDAEIFNDVVLSYFKEMKFTLPNRKRKGTRTEIVIHLRFLCQSS